MKIRSSIRPLVGFREFRPIAHHRCCRVPGSTSKSGEQRSQSIPRVGCYDSLAFASFVQATARAFDVHLPLDPDRDRMLMTVPTPEYRDRLAEDLFRQLPEVTEPTITA
ncbi:MAG: hypothetical protein R3C56_04245 [Pirellulaceae bacterium]